MSIRHLLTLNDLTSSELETLIIRAIELKKIQHQGTPHELLKNKTLAMIFEKSSTRTRVSFESAMIHFGGGSLFLSPRDTQLGRGEPIEDTARVISSMVDGIIIRTFEHKKIEQFAKYSSVPVINALTDDYHPCQLLADIQTFHEHRGSISGKTVCWIGDGNNMCHSYMNAASLFNFQLNICCPAGFNPKDEIITKNKNNIQLIRKPMEAVKDAHLVVTDVWASMGMETEQAERIKKFSEYQVTKQLLDKASPEALFMHCLPAHRGEEVSNTLLEDKRSVVWDEAENRLHAQKSLLEFLMT